MKNFLHFITKRVKTEDRTDMFLTLAFYWVMFVVAVTAVIEAFL